MTELTYVPWSECRVGHWNALVYVGLDIPKLQEGIVRNQAVLEQEAENHLDNCEWWGDWTKCSCGGR